MEHIQSTINNFVSTFEAMELSARNLGGLPPELLIEVLSHVRVRDILNMRRLNTAYNQFFQNFQDQLADRIMARERQRIAADIRDLDFHGIDMLTAVSRYLRVIKTHLYPRFDYDDAISEAGMLGRLYAIQNPDPWRRRSFRDQMDATTRWQPSYFAAEMFARQIMERMNAAWSTRCMVQRASIREIQEILQALNIPLGDEVVASTLRAAERNAVTPGDEFHPVSGADNSVRIYELDAMLHRHARNHSTMPNVKAHFWKWKKEAFALLGLPRIAEIEVWPTFMWPTDYSRRERKLRSWEILCDRYNIGRRPSRIQMAAVLEDASLGLKSDWKDVWKDVWYQD